MDSVTNYRPVSLLSNLSKVSEKVIYKRMSGFLESNNILDPCQFGFRPKHGTVDAVTTLVKEGLQGMDKHNYTLAVFCDLLKSFGTLEHTILLNKLSHYGFRGNALQLVNIYLSEREQYVCNSGINSDTAKLPNYGVPRDSY